MKQYPKWLTAALAVVGGLIIAGSAQAQYVTGDQYLDNVTMGGGSFGNTTGANGLTLTGTGYNWGEWDIAPAQQQTFNPLDNEVIMTYTINSPAAGTTGPDYVNGAAWTWVGLQPLINTTANLERYGGYDGYNLTYSPINGQNIANQDKGYVYNNGVVTETIPLNSITKADLAGGNPVTFFQISLDPTSTLPDGFSVTINSLELVATPEPSTLALAGLGLSVVGLMIARRRFSVS